MNIDAKILNKILAKAGGSNTSKRSYTMTKSVSF
jgi:hypothetical protein